jgi:hypothetical protein
MEEEIKLMRNGVEVKLKGLGTDGIEDFLVILDCMSKMPKIDFRGKSEEERTELGKEIFKYLSPDGRKSLSNLVKMTLKKTYPNYTDEDDEWGMENFMTIFPKIIEMCMPKDHEFMKKQEVHEKVKKLQQT